MNPKLSYLSNLAKPSIRKLAILAVPFFVSLLLATSVSGCEYDPNNPYFKSCD